MKKYSLVKEEAVKLTARFTQHVCYQCGDITRVLSVGKNEGGVCEPCALEISTLFANNPKNSDE